MNDAFGNSLDHLHKRDRVRHVITAGPTIESSGTTLGQQGTIIDETDDAFHVRLDNDQTRWFKGHQLVEDNELPRHPCINRDGTGDGIVAEHNAHLRGEE